MRKVRQIMGMPITIDVPQCRDAAFFEPIFRRLTEIDNRFSTYKPESEVSKFLAGQIKENQLSKELNAVIKACKEAQEMTDGYFSAWASGQFDPSGFVKGWAVAQAGRLIKKNYKTYCISAGGDILAGSDGSKTWQIGLQDPQDKSKMLNRVSISNGAIATSGNYERGPHIINPKTGRPAQDLLSVTVTGPGIVKADILATATFAKGDADLMENQTGYEALIIAQDRTS